MNQDFDNFKQSIIEFSNFLDNIPPYEYSLYATIIAYIISSLLSLNALNALGNWFEQVGQIMLTIAAQASATPSDEEYNALVQEVKALRIEVERLKNKN